VLVGLDFSRRHGGVCWGGERSGKGDRVVSKGLKTGVGGLVGWGGGWNEETNRLLFGFRILMPRSSQSSCW
jgi:hypothetical protein